MVSYLEKNRMWKGQGQGQKAAGAAVSEEREGRGAGAAKAPAEEKEETAATTEGLSEQERHELMKKWTTTIRAGPRAKPLESEGVDEFSNAGGIV
jgi:hypothetical protein